MKLQVHLTKTVIDFYLCFTVVLIINVHHFLSSTVLDSATTIVRLRLYSFSFSCTMHLCKIDALDQWCLRMLLGINWYHFVRNDDVWRLTKQPKLTAIIQSRQLTLFGHIMHMDDNADAKRIPLAWRRQPGRPRITWLSTIQQDLKQHHLTLPEAADLAQNRPLWRMMSTFGATQS